MLGFMIMAAIIFVQTYFCSRKSFDSNLSMLQYFMQPVVLYPGSVAIHHGDRAYDVESIKVAA